MRIKQVRFTSSIRISLVICALLFVACDNDDNGSGFTQPNLAPVSAVQLSVDKANFTGTCPHTFKFTGTITTSGAGIVGWIIDLNDEFSGGTVAAVKFSSAGTQTVTDEVTLSQSWQGEAILEIPHQNFLRSNSVSITATCQ